MSKSKIISIASASKGDKCKDVQSCLWFCLFLFQQYILLEMMHIRVEHCSTRFSLIIALNRIHITHIRCRIYQIIFYSSIDILSDHKTVYQRSTFYAIFFSTNQYDCNFLTIMYWASNDTISYIFCNWTTNKKSLW